MSGSISDAERPKVADEKTGPVVAANDVETGHLQEIEVDIAEALNEGGKEYDLDADHSPYPEGTCPQFAPCDLSSTNRIQSGL